MDVHRNGNLLRFLVEILVGTAKQGNLVSPNPNWVSRSLRTPRHKCMYDYETTQTRHVYAHVEYFFIIDCYRQSYSAGVDNLSYVHKEAKGLRLWRMWSPYNQ